MTTGRINQVTTLADRAFRPTHRWMASSARSPVRQPTERGAHAARASFIWHCSPNLLSPTERNAPPSSVDERNARFDISLRLPNTPCEVGILKTVEFVTNEHQPESIVPDCFNQPTIVHAGHALAVRLSAGHLRSRRCEKTRGEVPTT